MNASVSSATLDKAAAVQEIWSALQEVADPEIPRLSVVDLGVITDVSFDEASRAARIMMTPTFSGCPAIEYMKTEVGDKARSLPFVAEVEVRVSFEEPWNSNKISDRGRAILRESGFAPPPKHNGYIELAVLERVPCPYCGSAETELQTPFGPTLCRSIHYCRSCSQAFEQFKPLA
jgi:ring-1,2-phenylacetyl-CoA epoxidase subunit PaaD